MVSAGSRAGPFRERGVRFTSIRGRHGGRPKRHVGRDRRRPGVVIPANRAAAVTRVMVLLQLFDVGLIGTRQQQIHAVIVITVLRCAVDQTLAQLLVG